MGGVVSEITQPCCSGECSDASTERTIEATGPPPPGSYVVTLDRNIDKKLGLDVQQRKDGDKLPIRGITGGLAERWNKTHPETPIKPGDQIIEVNGMKGDIAGMMARCRSDQVLKMIIAKAVDGPAPTAQQAFGGSVATSSSDQADLGPLPPPPEADDNQAREVQYEEPRHDAPNVDRASLNSLVSMGFSEADSKNALLRCGGNVDAAVMSLTGAAGGEAEGNEDATPARAGGGNTNDSVAQLTAMGFDEEQAKKALAAAGGDVEQAVVLISSGIQGGAEDPPGVQEIMAMGFTHQQAINALDGAGGNVNRAINFLMDGSGT